MIKSIKGFASKTANKIEKIITVTTFTNQFDIDIANKVVYCIASSETNPFILKDTIMKEICESRFISSLVRESEVITM